MSRTFRRGLVGIVVWVGGGAREELREGGPRFGRGDRCGSRLVDPFACGRRVGVAFSRGAPRAPFEALCAELRAGKEGTEGSTGESTSVKDGAWEARGVGGEFGVGGGGFLRSGGGGGGIALRSSSCFVASASFASCGIFDSIVLSSSLF